MAGLVLVDLVPHGVAEKDLAIMPEAEHEEVRAYYAGRDPSLASPIDWVASDEELAAALPPPLVPAMLLSHGVDDPDAPPEVEALWRELQEQEARELNARFVIAERSGHFIPIDQPDLASAVIRAVVEAGRDPSW